jgi:predicted Zn-dependent protease
MAMIGNLCRMLEQGQDSALLRFSLGGAYLKADQPREAIVHLHQAVAQDPGYSAAWKLLGQALVAAGQDAAALDAYTRGIEVAERKGDKQAAKEMTVFKRRIQRALG